MRGRRPSRRRASGPGGSARAAAVPEAGQAQVELLAGIPVLLLAGLVAAQLLCFGYVQMLADGAAEAAAIAAADGRDPLVAAREALPGWARDGVELDDDGEGGFSLEAVVPAIVPGLGDGLRADAEAWVRPAAGSGVEGG
jgi:hypothetical protein